MRHLADLPTYVGAGLGFVLAAVVIVMALAWLDFHIRCGRDEAAYEQRKAAKAAEFAQLEALFSAPAHDAEPRQAWP